MTIITRPPARPARVTRTIAAVVALALLQACFEEPDNSLVMVKLNGDGTTAVAGQAVPILPSVKVTNGVRGVGGITITFAVASGGGSLTGGAQITDESGNATVGSWVLGPVPGANTMTAAVGTIAGSPATFTATGTAAPAPRVLPAAPTR